MEWYYAIRKEESVRENWEDLYDEKTDEKWSKQNQNFFFL